MSEENPIPFDERVDREYADFKDGESRDYSFLYLANTDCRNCRHDWHKGRACSCGCSNFELGDF